MMISLFWMRPEQRISTLGRCALVALLWGALCTLQVLLGYAAKLVACAYVVRHNAAQGGKPGPRVIHVKDSLTATGMAGGGGGGAGASGGKGGGSGVGGGVGPFAAAQTSQTQGGARQKAE
jgi:hypothetical protein